MSKTHTHTHSIWLASDRAFTQVLEVAFFPRSFFSLFSFACWRVLLSSYFFSSSLPFPSFARLYLVKARRCTVFFKTQPQRTRQGQGKEPTRRILTRTDIQISTIPDHHHVAYSFRSNTKLIHPMTVKPFHVLLLLLVGVSTTTAFYLPGLAPNVFCKNPIPDSKCKVSSAHRVDAREMQPCSPD